MISTNVTETTLVESVNTHCNHIIYLPSANVTALKRNHNYFYCTICGKRQCWSGTSDLERLRGALATAKDQRDTARHLTQKEREKVRKKSRQLSAQKGVTTRIKNRIAAGVCPCCNRTFKNLARHMKGKHPNYTDNEK